LDRNNQESQELQVTVGSHTSALALDQALDWVAELFEEHRENVTETTAREDIPAWDSLGQLVLMSALDERFGIRLLQDELSKLASVRDILEILRKNGRLSA
jgi:acyl carrier protein